jgi:hypothetical protein
MYTRVYQRPGPQVQKFSTFAQRLRYRTQTAIWSSGLRWMSGTGQPGAG